MPFKTLDSQLSASPQLSPEDVAAAAAQGFRTIIDLRPDDEEPNQPVSATIAAAAKENGMAFVHIPVVPGQGNESQVAEMTRALDENPGPALGYCRTGTRVAALWALGNAGKVDPERLIRTAGDAGYDIEKLRPRLQSA